MRKGFIYMLFAGIMGSLSSCESNELSNGSIDSNNQTKYVIEEASWSTYSLGDTSGEFNNKVSKTIYTRKLGDSKYLLAIDSYYDGNLYNHVDVVNEGNKEVRSVSGGGFQETTIYYDEQRTKTKEYWNSYGDSNIVEYDEMDRELLVKSYYNKRLAAEIDFKYVGLTKYMEKKQYSTSGRLELLYYDTLTYVDNTFKQVKQSCTSTVEVSSSKVLNRCVVENTYGPHGIVTKKTTGISYGQGDNVYEYIYYVNNTWEDALNYTFKEESYLNGDLQSKFEGYTKFTY